MDKFTRKQYLNNECTHRQYYAQFVTEGTKLRVKRMVGETKIIESTEEHLNDIPLHIWDMVGTAGVSEKMRECGDYLTLAGANCINKEAARQIQEDYHNKAA